MESSDEYQLLPSGKYTDPNRYDNDTEEDDDLAGSPTVRRRPTLKRLELAVPDQEQKIRVHFNAGECFFSVIDLLKLLTGRNTRICHHLIERKLKRVFSFAAFRLPDHKQRQVVMVERVLIPSLMNSDVLVVDAGARERLQLFLDDGMDAAIEALRAEHRRCLEDALSDLSDDNTDRAEKRGTPDDAMSMDPDTPSKKNRLSPPAACPPVGAASAPTDASPDASTEAPVEAPTGDSVDASFDASFDASVDASDAVDDDLKSQLKSAIKSELKLEIKEEVKSELKLRLSDATRFSIIEETKTELMEELHSLIRTDVGREMEKTNQRLAEAVRLLNNNQMLTYNVRGEFHMMCAKLNRLEEDVRVRDEAIRLRDFVINDCRETIERQQQLISLQNHRAQQLFNSMQMVMERGPTQYYQGYQMNNFQGLREVRPYARQPEHLDSIVGTASADARFETCTGDVGDHAGYTVCAADKPAGDVVTSQKSKKFVPKIPVDPRLKKNGQNPRA